MSHNLDDPFTLAVYKAQGWLRVIADSLDTDDRAFAYRALPTWMHPMRDRTSVTGPAHPAARLPEIPRRAN
ncbi:DUF2267 domain-containing protein [Nocardia vinacea]|uniref:hypothetical protein n=1 Tax=Nocardia vinacea TaxID=96468 RepID=UPI002E14BBCF|nr:DUF2267 domain-containing protein [Nocardia vinacea]